jgi:hypothetical protein
MRHEIVLLRRRLLPKSAHLWSCGAENGPPGMFMQPGRLNAMGQKLRHSRGTLMRIAAQQRSIDENCGTAEEH